MVAAKRNATALGCKKNQVLNQVFTSSVENTVVCLQKHTEDSKPEFPQSPRTKTGAVWKQGEEAEEGSVSVTDRRGVLDEHRIGCGGRKV